MGTLALGLNPLTKFEGEDAVTPKEREMCYDDSTGDIYVFKFVDGKWRKFSRTAEIQRKLDELEASGVFTSAAAFVSNRKIYRFNNIDCNSVDLTDCFTKARSLTTIYRFMGGCSK